MKAPLCQLASMCFALLTAGAGVAGGRALASDAGAPVTVELTAEFGGTTPARLYEIYLSSAEHAAFTGFPAAIDPREGGSFVAFENVPVPGAAGISGRILQLDAAARAPGQYVIVQSWRGYHDAPTDPDTTLVLTFTKTDTGAQIKLVQANVPAATEAVVVDSWQTRYWAPLATYVKAHPTR